MQGRKKKKKRGDEWWCDGGEITCFLAAKVVFFHRTTISSSYTHFGYKEKEGGGIKNTHCCIDTLVGLKAKTPLWRDSRRVKGRKKKEGIGTISR